MTFDDRDLYLIRLHILHHAVEGPIFGLGMAEELARHGYRISPGTIYPLLHGLERCDPLNAATENCCARSIVARHQDDGRLKKPNPKFGNCSAN